MLCALLAALLTASSLSPGVKSASALESDPVIGNWVMTYDGTKKALVEISEAAGVYQGVSLEPTKVAGFTTCVLPAGTVLVKFSKASPGNAQAKLACGTPSPANSRNGRHSELTLEGETLSGVIGESLRCWLSTSLHEAETHPTATAHRPRQRLSFRNLRPRSVHRRRSSALRLRALR